MAGRRRKYVDGDRILALMTAGKSGDDITATLQAEGWTVSKATVVRRMRELRPQVQSARAARAPAPADSSSEDLPEGEVALDGASVAQLDRWIRQAEVAIDKAEAAGDLGLMSNLLRTADSLAKTRAKVAPVTPPDPNAHPDMIAAAKRAREMLHKLVDSAVEG